MKPQERAFSVTYLGRRIFMQEQDKIPFSIELPAHDSQPENGPGHRESGVKRQGM